MSEVTVNIPEPVEDTLSIPTEIAIEVGKTSEAVDNVEERVSKIESELSSIRVLLESIPTVEAVDYSKIQEMIESAIEIEEDEEAEEVEEGLTVEELDEVTPEVESVEEPKKEHTGILSKVWQMIY